MPGDLGVERAIKAAGSMRKLAKLLGIRQQSVCKWKKIPAHHILEIERLTGVPREELRPDLYRRI
jgi:DNA-binding transcriptional regulator YdaS (Cro superfamily)